MNWVWASDTSDWPIRNQIRVPAHIRANASKARERALRGSPTVGSKPSNRATELTPSRHMSKAFFFCEGTDQDFVNVALSMGFLRSTESSVSVTFMNWITFLCLTAF